MGFRERLTAPDLGNKFYNTSANGGYSKCIIGNANPYNGGSARKGYTGLNVLPNCVGYALGRFNELIGSWKYSIPGNAEDFYDNAPKLGLKVGQTPKLGAIAVWRKGNIHNSQDGCGHVMIVERIISDTEILCSESGWSYNKGAMWVATHKKGNGQWIEGGDYNWMKNGYYFLGFVYNPAVQDEQPQSIKVEAYGNTYTVSSIIRDDTNYVKLVDMDQVLHLCAVGWINNKVYINGKPQDMTKLAVINYSNTNYVRLRDFDLVLKLCKVSYSATKKMPVITV